MLVLFERLYITFTTLDAAFHGVNLVHDRARNIRQKNIHQRESDS